MTRSTLRAVALVPVVFSFVVSCDDPDEETIADADADTGSLADAGPSTDATDAFDVHHDPDAGDADVASGCPGAVGCPCDAAAECATGACALSADGGRACAARCDDGACGSGLVCGQVDGGAACVEPHLMLCQPCREDADCAMGGDTAARCVPHDGGTFCAVPCDGGCPAGYTCTSDAVCLPSGGAACECNDLGVALGAATACVLDGDAACAAARVCELASGAPTLSACGPADLSREVCDGVDDDCDGTIDEGCDVDDDGFCDARATVLDAADCDPGDCDDADAAVHPGASEGAADGVDQDCDGAELCYLDGDRDGARATTTALATIDDRGVCPRVSGFALADAILDCDDAASSVYTGAPEVVGNGVDEDCDARELCFTDADADGARGTSTATSVDLTCTSALSLALGTAPLDCDDGDVAVHPGATELPGDARDQDCDLRELCYVDGDRDGARTAATMLASDLSCSQVDGLALAAASLDCDDAASDVHPGAEEVTADGVDHDCDGVYRCYLDGDEDGARAASVVDADAPCALALGTALAAAPLDCDDTDAMSHPGAVELVGDGVDQSCDGLELCHVDVDRDGFRVAATVATAALSCPRDLGLATPTAALDCDDARAAIHPDAVEVAGDGVDQDCDLRELCYVDADLDGARTTTTTAVDGVLCLTSAGHALAAALLDCADGDAAISPSAAELAGDDVDQDCDGRELCFADRDEDGFRASVATLTEAPTCGQGFLPITVAIDCDDDVAAIQPGADELAGDGVDQDCDGRELCFVDADHDGDRVALTTSAPDMSCLAAHGLALAAAALDCDDDDDTVHHGADELAGDVVDSDCDGLELCFLDEDEDGVRGLATIATADIACEEDGHFVALAPLDCDDDDDSIYPGALDVPGDGVDSDCLPDGQCFVDADKDGARTEVLVAGGDGCLTASGLAPAAAPIDCDDGDATRHPAATEAPADGVDQTCDGKELCYLDADQDGARATALILTAGTSCTQAEGYALAAAPIDCDDTMDLVYPGATELAGDGVDQSCDERELCYVDGDHDGARTSATTLSVDRTCLMAAGLALSTAALDCDDQRPLIHPGATEQVGDGVDQDCDARELCYLDADQDGARTTTSVDVAGIACLTLSGHALATAALDCADGDAAVHPGAVELAGDGFDQDCDARELCYRDDDEDGARTAATSLAAGMSCGQSDGLALAAAALDCDDQRDSVHPGATELVADGVDQTCDGLEHCYVDADRDGFRTDETTPSQDVTCSGNGLALASAVLDCDDQASDVHVGATELSDDGLDSDCDGYELFDDNLLAVSGAMGVGPFSVVVAGPFGMPHFGSVAVTGTATRAALGEPVTWCVAASVAQDFGAFSFSGTATVCRTLAGSAPAVALSGSAQGDGSTTAWSVVGAAARGAPFDVLLAPHGEVTVRGDAYVVNADPLRSSFSVVSGVGAWHAEASAASVALDSAITARGVTLSFDPSGVDLAATIALALGEHEVSFGASGAYGTSGPYTLDLASSPQASFLIFPPDELPQQIRALGAVGTLEGDGDGNAQAELSSRHFCAGDCCYPHAYGGCEVPAMRACAGVHASNCGLSWSAACVAALDQCDLELGDLLTFKDPIVRVTAGDGQPYAPTIYGSPSVTGFGILDVPPMTMRTVRGSCRDSTTRYCAWTHDASCTNDSWSETCDDIVAADCGGAAATAKCAVGPVFASAELEGIWHIGGQEMSARFGVRDAWWDLYWRPGHETPGTPLNPLDSASWIVEGSLRADGMVCLSGECSESWWETAPSGSTWPDDGARVFPMRGLFTEDNKYLIGEVADLHLPIFESPAGAAIVMSAAPLPLAGGGSFDIMDTPDEPGDDIALPEGLTFVAFGPMSIPIPIEQIESSFPVPMWAVMANVQLSSLAIEAQANFNWTFIPEGVIPTVRALKYQGVRAYAKVGLGSVVKYLFSPGIGLVKNFFGKEHKAGKASDIEITLGMEAGAELHLTNQEAPLVGKVNMEFKPDKAGGIIGGNVYLAGKWIEPFGLADMAMQTFGLSLYLNIETGVPVAAGFSRNLYWRPPECQWPPQSQDWVADHGCLLAFEVGFFYEPWTDLMVNGELSNISLNTAGGILNSMAKSAVNVVNFALGEVDDPTLIWTKLFKDLVWDSALLQELIGTVSIPPLPAPPQIPEIPGFDIQLETARIYYAPKPNYRWGQYYPPGGVIEGKININDEWGGHVFAELENLAFIPKALHLYGDIDPIVLGPLQLVGDPYARAVTLGGGHIAIPHDASLLPEPVSDDLGTSVQLTVEGWVKKGVWAEGESAVLFAKDDGVNGVTVRVARLGESDVPLASTKYPDIAGDDESDEIEFDTTGNDPGAERGWIVVEVKNDGELRTYRSERGVMPASPDWQHLAVMVRGTEAAALVDARPLTLIAEGPAVDIGATEVDALAGQGFDALDELRVWRRFRQPVDVNWNRKYLGVAMSQSPDLLLRYTFDWDAAGGPAHNSRNVPALDGTLVGGAVTAPELSDHIAWRLDLDWLTLPPTASMAMQAGASIPIPLLPEPLTFRMWSHYDTEALVTTGEFYARRQQILATPWGGLRIDGDGPNLVRGDFDDGLYGSMEAGFDAIGLAGSGRLDWLPSDSTEATTVGSAELFVGCPPGQSCADFSDYIFNVVGNLDLTMHLPPLPAVRLLGDVDIDSVARTLAMSGSVTIGTLTLLSGDIYGDSEHLSFTTSLTLPELFGENLLSMETSLELVFEPFSLCGSGVIDGPGIIDCNAEVCLTFADGAPSIRLHALQCFGLCWHDGMCEENQFCDLLGECHGKKPNGAECAGLVVGAHECISGFCDPWKSFPTAVCADPLPDWVGCTENAQCISGHCGNQNITGRKMCYTPASELMGEECADDLACVIGLCWGTLIQNPRCLCHTNEQCADSVNIADGYVCKTGDWGVTALAGQCIPPRAVGEACDAQSECQAGLHCGSGVCYVPHTQTNFGACLGATHCQTGTCYLGTCRCSTHEECRADDAYGADAYCDQGTWLAGNNEGKCHPAKSADGGYCEDAAWCTSGYCDPSNICVTPASKHNWQACSVPIECVSGSCYAGQCRCSDHSECHSDPAFGGEAYCDIGTWAVGNQEGRCYAQKSGDGAYCEDTTWCSSGYCAGNRCYTPRSKHNWQGCVSGDECISGGCFEGLCRCSEHAECVADSAFGEASYCNRGTWLAGNLEGQCRKPKLADGNPCEESIWCASDYCDPSGICVTPASKHNWQACSVPAECVSGSCYAGQCRCSNTAECQADSAFGGDSYCDAGNWLAGNEEGRCHTPKVADGAYCEDTTWCSSGYCAGNRCYTPRSKHNWEGCVTGDECISGGCFEGQCRCSEHAECVADSAFGETSYCNRGTWLAGNLEGQCRKPKLADGNPCEESIWCASGYCDPSGICVTPASKHNWQACSVPVECVSGSCFAGQCRCGNTSECQADSGFGSDSFCNAGAWGVGNEEGRCHAPKHADGGYCEDATWCGSGTCISGICVTPSSKHNWEACTFPQECISGTCFGGQCRCSNSAECAADSAFGDNSYCNEGPWFVGNVEGQCNAGKVPEGYFCENDSWCETGACSPFGTCYQRHTRHNWESCVFGDECISGGCYAGQCRCGDHGDCQEDAPFANGYCDMGEWHPSNQEGKCHPVKSGFDAYCEDGNWCQSGVCLYVFPVGNRCR